MYVLGDPVSALPALIGSPILAAGLLSIKVLLEPLSILLGQGHLPHPQQLVVLSPILAAPLLFIKVLVLACTTYPKHLGLQVQATLSPLSNALNLFIVCIKGGGIHLEHHLHRSFLSTLVFL